MRGHWSAVICTRSQSSFEDQARWNSPLAPAGVESRICCAAGAAASIGEIVAHSSSRTRDRLVDDQHRRPVVAQRQAAQHGGTIARQADRQST